MYSLRTLLYVVILVIVVLVVLFFLYQVLRPHNPERIRDRIRRWTKALPVILVLSILGGAVNYAYQAAGVNLFGSFKIGYNYPSASKGLTPNNTKLNSEEILSEEVLESAISEGNLEGLEVYDLKRALTVNNALQREDVSTENYYLSTEYVVNYRATEATQRYDDDTVLRAVYNAYYNYFVDKYGRKTNVITQDYSEISDLDYLDIYTYFYTRINEIIQYMSMCREESPSFISEETRESFDSILEKAQDFRDVSLERYNAYVLKNGLAKDKEGYIARLNYDNQITNVNYMKNLAGYSVRLNAIDKYAGDITTAVLVPSRDEEGEFYQSRTKIGTDYFAADANQYLQSATDRQLEIEQNNYRIEMLEAGDGGEAEVNKAEEMIEDLENRILELSSLAVQTVEDYDEQNLDDYMDVSYSTGNDDISYMAVNALIYGGFILGICSFAVLLGGEVKTGKRKGRAL